MYELTPLGKTKADQLDIIHNAEEAILAVLAERNMPMDADELAAALNSSEEKMGRVCRHLESKGLLKSPDELGAHAPRHPFAARRQVSYDEPKGSTAERILASGSNATLGFMKGLGKLAVGAAKYANKRGIEGLVIGDTEALVGTGRKRRKLEREIRYRDRFLRRED